jgi:protein-S-isoprenylcysteine O-methyltransferase Ste14
MARPLSILGVGPALALVTLPALAGAIAVTALHHDAVRFPLLPRAVTVAAGLALGACGVALYAGTVPKLLHDFEAGRLARDGTYAWCRHPLYASVIVLLMPAAGLLADAWPVSAVALVMYAGFKALIGREDRALEAQFGDAYRRYVAEVNELLPRPPRAHAPPAGTEV